MATYWIVEVDDVEVFRQTGTDAFVNSLRTLRKSYGIVDNRSTHDVRWAVNHVDPTGRFAGIISYLSDIKKGTLVKAN